VRVALAVIQTELAAISRSLARQTAPTYDDIIKNSDPPSFPFANQTDVREAVALFNDLQKLSARLQSAQVNLTDRAPKPAPELRAVPRV
jgi:hypothetical protein